MTRRRRSPRPPHPFAPASARPSSSSSPLTSVASSDPTMPLALAITVAVGIAAVIAAGLAGPSTAPAAFPDPPTAVAHAPAGDPDADRGARRDALVRGGVPSWAADGVLDLLLTRDRPGRVAVFDEPCALDAEVDLLAAATLALEEPDGVIAIYGQWYPAGAAVRAGQSSLRTPAAPLLLARALRLRAWHQFDPPPERRALTPVPDRLKAFESANLDLARAANLLDAYLGNLYDAAAPTPASAAPESLAKWMALGVPKPTRAKPDERAPLPAFQAADFVKDYLALRALVLRELGDLVYRETGSALSAGRQDGGAQSTALGWYALARNDLFLARLMFHDDRGLRAEAKAVAGRIGWARGGMLFGGADFYQFEPYDHDTYLTQSLAALRADTASIDEMERRDATGRAAQTGWLASLRQQQQTRQVLDQAFKAQATRELTALVVEMRGKLTAVRTARTLARVERAERALSTFIQEQGVALQAAQYGGELRRAREALVQELVRQIDDLRRHGGVHPVGEIGGVLDDETFQELDRWVKTLVPAPTAGPATAPRPAADDLIAQVDRAWRELLHPPADAPGTRAGAPAEVGAGANAAPLVPLTPPTTIGQLYAKWRAAALEHARQASLREMELLRQAVTDLSAQQTDLAAQHDADSAELKKVWDKFIAARADALQKGDLDALRKVVIPRLQKDVSQLAGRLRKAVEYVEKFQDALRRVKALVAAVQKAKRMVETGAERLVEVVNAAKALPDTISGTLSGVMTSPGKALISGAEALMKKVEAMYQGTFDAAELDKQITDAEAKAIEFLNRAADMERELSERKAVLDAALSKEATAKDFSAPDGAVYKQFASRQKELEDAVREVSGRLDGVRHALNVKEGQIKAMELAERQNRIDQAGFAAAAARGAVDQAVLERDHRLAQVAALKGRLVSLAAEAANLSALTDLYDSGLRRRQAEVGVALADERALTADQRDDEVATRAALDVFEARLAALARPAARVVTRELLDEVAPALALAQIRPTPADRQTAIDRANAYLLRCARWLYVLGGDPGAIAVGSPCRSSRELAIAAAEIEARWRGVRAAFGGAQYKAIILSFDAEQLAAAGGGDRLVFRTVAGFAPRSRVAAAPRDASDALADPKLFSDRAIWEYSPAKSRPGGGPTAADLPTFFLSQVALETGGVGVLHGAWALCEWDTADGKAPPLTVTLLERVGPVKVRRGGRERELLLKSEEGFGRNPLVFGDFCRLGNVQRFFAELRPADDRALEDPYRGQPYAHFFGLGLDGTWTFSAFASDPHGQERAGALARLRRVRVLLTYLAPTSASAVAARAEPSAADGPMDLTPLLAADGGGRAVPDEKGEAEFWGSDLWQTFPANAAGRRANRLNEIEKAVRDGAALAGPDVDALVSAELDRLYRQTAAAAGPGADAALRVLQPVDVAGGLAKARTILRHLVTALGNEYHAPLKAAHGALTDFADPVAGRVEEFAQALARNNRLYLDLLAYERTLSDVLAKLAGDTLNEKEQETLAGLIKRSPWPEALEFHVASAVANDPGETRRAMLARLLSKVHDAVVTDNPGGQGPGLGPGSK